MHLKIRNPSEIMQADVDANTGIEQRSQVIRSRKLRPDISLVAIDENKPTVVREWREQHEPARPHYNTAALRRAWELNFCIVISFAVEMLLHRMARDAVGSAGAQHVSRRELFCLATGFERYTQAIRLVLDRLYLRAVFDLDAEAFQMFAQDCLGAPLWQAALKFVLAPDIGEFCGRDFPQTRTEHLHLPDVHAGAKKRLDQSTPLDNLQYRRLQSGAASLVMRRESALHDARFDAVPEKFASRQQSGWAAPHEQDARSRGDLNVLVGSQRHDLSFVKGLSFAGNHRRSHSAM